MRRREPLEASGRLDDEAFEPGYRCWGMSCGGPPGGWAVQARAHVRRGKETRKSDQTVVPVML
jgi:hypothetical protein